MMKGCPEVNEPTAINHYHFTSIQTQEKASRWGNYTDSAKRVDCSDVQECSCLVGDADSASHGVPHKPCPSPRHGSVDKLEMKLAEGEDGKRHTQKIECVPPTATHLSRLSAEAVRLFSVAFPLRVGALVEQDRLQVDAKLTHRRRSRARTRTSYGQIAIERNFGVPGGISPLLFEVTGSAEVDELVE